MMKLRTLALSTLAVGGLMAGMSQAAQARVIVNLNTGYQAPVQQCQGYTRTFIDGYGYQRTATGTACLQPNGEWTVVSERLNSMPYGRYPDRVIYRDAPSYYVQPQVVYLDDRNMHWDHHDDHHDNGHHYGHH